MVQRRIGSILNQTASSLPSGVSFETYLRATGRTLDQVVEELRPDAEMAIRRELVVEAVCEAQHIQVTDAEVEAQVREDAETVGRDADELLAEVRRRRGPSSVCARTSGWAARSSSWSTAPCRSPWSRPRRASACGRPRRKRRPSEAKLWTPGDAK